MTRAARRRQAAALQIHLGVGETQEWRSDETFREEALKSFRQQARERGRRWVEVFAADGGGLMVADL